MNRHWTKYLTLMGFCAFAIILNVNAHSKDISEYPVGEAIHIHFTGKDYSGASIKTDNRPLKCGTPVAEFLHTQELMDANPALAKLTATQAIFDRVAMQHSLVTPGGFFRIHYNTIGDSAVFQANVDLIGYLGAPGADGIPDYVNVIADIFDSVKNILLNDTLSGGLGYPIPPPDTLTIDMAGENPDSLYDVYLVNFRGQLFGATISESQVPFHFNNVDPFAPYTSYIQLDNDYQENSYSGGFNNYKKAPLDAVRVTFAHEFFHSVQFGIDRFEFPMYNTSQNFYFQEMSSVSMEEYIYDDINDYYAYLNSGTGITPFTQPYRSFQTFNLFTEDSDFPYAMGIFPIYLEQKFGPRVLWAAWMACGRQGPDALGALDSALVSLTSGEYNFNRAYSEFGRWLVMTGSRAALAGPGDRFEEADSYPMLTQNQVRDTFPVTLPANNQTPKPESNAHSFVFLEKVTRVQGFKSDCFKPLVVVPKAPNLDSGLIPRISLITINCDGTSISQIIEKQLKDSILFDSLYFVSEASHAAFVAAKQTEYYCHDFIVIDTMSTVNNGLEDTLRIRVRDVFPALPVYDIQDNSTAILAITQTTLDENKYLNSSGVARYAYGYLVRDSTKFPLGNCTDPNSPDFSGRTVEIKYPYPNPATGNVARVTFAADIIQPTVSFDDVEMHVTLFTEDGAKMKTILPVSSFATVQRLSVDWDLTNDSGEPVASGVYIALIQLTDAGGSVIEQKTSKVMVIR